MRILDSVGDSRDALVFRDLRCHSFFKRYKVFIRVLVDGDTVASVCRFYGISRLTFYSWKKDDIFIAKFSEIREILVKRRELASSKREEVKRRETIRENRVYAREEQNRRRKQRKKKKKTKRQRRN